MPAWGRFLLCLEVVVQPTRLAKPANQSESHDDKTNEVLNEAIAGRVDAKHVHAGAKTAIEIEPNVPSIRQGIYSLLGRRAVAFPKP
jgi:hypothetical protein